MGIHWYHCNPTFLWKINFTLVRRLISALIWDISGLGNRSDGRDFREKRIDISRFLTPYAYKPRCIGKLEKNEFLWWNLTHSLYLQGVYAKSTHFCNIDLSGFYEWNMAKNGSFSFKILSAFRICPFFKAQTITECVRTA